MSNEESQELQLTSAAIDIYGAPSAGVLSQDAEAVLWGGAIHFPTQHSPGLSLLTTTLQALMPAVGGAKAHITLVLLLRGGEAVITRCTWTIENGYGFRTLENGYVYRKDAEERIARYFAEESVRRTGSGGTGLITESKMPV